VLKVAVSGASGFVGKHVVAALEKRSISPILICRPSAAAPSAFTRHKIVPIDLLDCPDDAFHLMGEPDVLIHLAWGGLPNYQSLHHFETELPMQYRFLKRLIDSGLSNVLVTGTCFEYGMQSGQLSEDLGTAPANPYGFAKDALRSQLNYLQKAKPYNLTWARLFYLYGDGQAENALFPQLRATIQRGDPVFNMSRGDQLRDYLPVGEVASCLVNLAMNAEDNGIVNICSGKPVSVRSLVESWVAENGWDIRLNMGYYPYPSHEPMAFWGNRTKLNRLLQNVIVQVGWRK
jgi:dTDP-6-deoxy-L-talose 4-dehydrogenase (NAD+)